MNYKRKSRRRFFLLMRSRTPPISSEFRGGGLNTPKPPLGTPLFKVVSFPQISPPKPCMLLSPKCGTFLTHLILLDFFTRTISGEQYRSLSSSLRSFLHSPVTSSLLDPNVFLNTLFSNTLSLTFLPQCERPSFTTIQNKRQNYSSVYLNFKFLYRKLEDKSPPSSFLQLLLNLSARHVSRVLSPASHLAVSCSAPGHYTCV